MLAILVFGILNGSVYALVGAGLGLTYGRQNLVDLANPAFVVVGAFLVLVLSQRLKLDPLVVAPFSVSALFFVGMLVHRLLITPLLARPAAELHTQSALILFALMLLIQALLVLTFSSDTYGVTTSYSNAVLAVGDLRLPVVKLIALALSLVTLFALHIFLKGTRFGKAMRATFSDRDTAQLLAINVKTIDLFTYGLGSAFAGMAGLVVALSFSFSAASILSLTVIGFTVAVVGGKGDALGILLAGLLVGVFEALVASTISPNWTYVAVYGFLLAVFFLRPQGLLGETR